ncbi:MAG: outer membrane beta-barrel protein [Methylovirgula sp.]
MASIKAIVIAGAFVIGIANVAGAADLLPPPPAPVPEAPPEMSGWYLRGDVGAGINMLSGQDSTFAVSVPNGFANNGSGVGVQGMIDLGAGYQINNWFRADVTGEYRWPAKYWGLESYVPGGLFPSPDCTTCYDRYSANISSAVFLVNGYVDLGTWYGITPFVGAGVGYTYNMFNNLTDVGIETGGYGTAPNRGYGSIAWAGMAGLSYWLTPNIRLEFSYRYLDLGNFVSNPIACVGGCGGNGAESEKFHLASNDIRIGLRYIFAEVPPPAPPLITKY